MLSVDWYRFKPHLKSKRLRYYNYNEQKTKSRTFSAIEIEHANKVFDTVEDILLENDLGIRDENKYVSSGKCSCQTHDDTFFMIEIDGDVLGINVIHDIEDALEDIRDVELINILARHDGRKDFLQLVIIQKQLPQD